MALFPPQRSRARRAAVLGLVPIGLLGGYVGGRLLRPAPLLPLEPALGGTVEHLDLPFGTLAYYCGGLSGAAPLLLIHSANAAASAYEVKPLYDHYGRTRAVYAIDLPGFGLSDRPDRIYTPRLMTDAVLAVIEEIRRRHGQFPVDAIAVSTAAEFLARAASERPTLVRSVAFVSPTGFQSKRSEEGEPGATRGRASLRDLLSFPLWGRRLFEGLVTRASLRFFLSKTWGSARIDEGLLDYSYRTAHQPGAEHAPFSFLSGFLFSADIVSVFKSLTGPVWMCHGTRGDFVDFKNKAEVETRPNWTIRVFETGALPYFENLGLVTEAYDAFREAAV